MEQKDKTKLLIKSGRNIPKNYLENIETEKDGNCLFRTFSLYFYKIKKIIMKYDKLFVKKKKTKRVN